MKKYKAPQIVFISHYKEDITNGSDNIQYGEKFGIVLDWENDG